ncbi:hypothetical protein BDM02DRAFT_3186012 [Thelephora ganbajun]|uniref:Uncharacterized protein n=1 Tax=Thelephora ganbajun TaxID=370292 RepID=A0ACB6ZK67_THEGA|nr:hypothetical protein BDM02DRAFT_3186012 [Thelephora ganbajun]
MAQPATSTGSISSFVGEALDGHGIERYTRAKLLGYIPDSRSICPSPTGAMIGMDLTYSLWSAYGNWIPGMKPLTQQAVTKIMKANLACHVLSLLRVWNPSPDSQPSSGSSTTPTFTGSHVRLILVSTLQNPTNAWFSHKAFEGNLIVKPTNGTIFVFNPQSGQLILKWKTVEEVAGLPESECWILSEFICSTSPTLSSRIVSSSFPPSSYDSKRRNKGLRPLLISVELKTESSDMAKIATPDPPVSLGSFLASTSDNFRLFGLQQGKYDHRFSLSIKLAQEMVSGLWARNSLARLPERCISPAEPFGGKDDFDVLGTHVTYIALDSELPLAWHTEKNVYVVDLEGQNRKEVTSGKQGATHPPVFSNYGTKVAWAELAEDEYGSDHAVLVVYNLKKDESYKLTPCWDRSPASISFSKDNKRIYSTAGSDARVKAFVVPVPASKPSSDKRLASPSNPYWWPSLVISELFHEAQRHLHSICKPSCLSSQLTMFTEELKEKPLDAREEFYFDGAERKIQGRILRQKGYSEDDRKKWASLLLIYVVLGALGKMGGRRDGIRMCLLNRDTSPSLLTHPVRPPLKKVSRIPSRKIEEASRLSIFEMDGNISSIAIFGLIGTVTEDVPRIQSNPDSEFRFKALVCRDGVWIFLDV